MSQPIPFPSTDTRDPDERLRDARAALACLEDVLSSFLPDGDLNNLHPHHLASFLRLVLAQFPEE